MFYFASMAPLLVEALGHKRNAHMCTYIHRKNTCQVLVFLGKPWFIVEAFTRSLKLITFISYITNNSLKGTGGRTQKDRSGRTWSTSRGSLSNMSSSRMSFCDGLVFWPLMRHPIDKLRIWKPKRFLGINSELVCMWPSLVHANKTSGDVPRLHLESLMQATASGTRLHPPRPRLSRDKRFRRSNVLRKTNRLYIALEQSSFGSKTCWFNRGTQSMQQRWVSI